MSPSFNCTTRDAVDVPFEVETEGVRQSYVLIDTAGVRKARRVDDSIEFFSVKRTEESIARCDIVIFVLSGRDELPAAVKEWIEMWAWFIEDTRPALVSLFESPNGESGSIRGYLRSVTARKHLDYFPDSASLPAPASRAGSTRTPGETPFTRQAWQNEEVGACREPMTRER